ERTRGNGSLQRRRRPASPPATRPTLGHRPRPRSRAAAVAYVRAMDAEQFRQLGHALVDWIADYRQTVAGGTVMSPAQPGEIKARMPSAPPEHGGAAGELIARLDADVLPGITHWSHPGFFAYFPSVTSYASILGDLACAGLGVQGMSWQTSP